MRSRRKWLQSWPSDSFELDVRHGVRIDTPVQPAPDELQVAIHCGLGHLHKGSGLFGGAAKEVPEFDELDLVRIDRVQVIQRAVQIDQRLAPDLDPGNLFVQRNVLSTAASLLRDIAPGVIGQDHAHDFGGEGVEVSAIRPVRFLLADQAQIHFVDQGGGLEHTRISLSWI